MTKLYLAIPCYNEEEVLLDSAEKLFNKYRQLMKAGRISKDSRIVFIDDGSSDKTWSIIQGLHEKIPMFSGIKLSCNRGHQNALLCGLITLKDYADAVISIDADLQDDIDAIDKMLDKYEQGSDIVYGVRSSRETDTKFKRFTAEAYYKILNKLGAKTIFNHADFRLMSKRALNIFAEYKEVNIFLRGMVPMIGLKSDIVEYERKERLAGESKYPLKKMLALAWEGITSLSVKPIRIITFIGLISVLISILRRTADRYARPTDSRGKGTLLPRTRQGWFQGSAGYSHPRSKKPQQPAVTAKAQKHAQRVPWAAHPPCPARREAIPASHPAGNPRKRRANRP